MDFVKLTDVCRPKQWKTISGKDLLTEGYPVYGANGIIGYWSDYNHSSETVTIACRGTCGTVNIVPAKSYINGNAMSLDNLSDTVNLRFLYYYLRGYDFKEIITGTTIPQITIEGLRKVLIPRLSLENQVELVHLFDIVQNVIDARQKEIQLLDDLIKARFVEMFGDPRANPFHFNKAALKDTCIVVTGNTPARAVQEYYGEYIEWIKTDNIVSGRLYPTTATEYLSEAGMRAGRTVDAGSILMACIAGSIASIGKVCITDRKVAFNQQINAVIPKDYNVSFLYVMLQLSKDYLVEEINMALKGILSKSKLEEKEFILPPLEKQEKFAAHVSQIDKSKSVIQKSLDETQLLFDSLMQEYFG